MTLAQEEKKSKEWLIVMLCTLRLQSTTTSPSMKQDLAVANSEEICVAEVDCLWESLSQCLDFPDMSFSNFLDVENEVATWETPSDGNISITR